MLQQDFLEEQRKVIPNRLADNQHGDDTAFERKPAEEPQTLTERLNIKDALFDEQVGFKVQAIENFFKEEAAKEGLKEETIFLRLAERFPTGWKFEVQKGNGLKILEHLFKEVAIRNKLSSESYLRIVSDKIKQERISFYLNKLKESLVNYA